MSDLPPEFIWGVATSAHQVEGNNCSNDWWEWEHCGSGACVEPSAGACDHYNKYPEDIALIAELGFNSYRFSIEWSRIEPERGHWDDDELEHYESVAQCCRSHGLRPIPTLHHFTNPLWLAHDGGWENPATPELFARFSGIAATRIGDLCDTLITVNEPNIPALLGYELGWFPPGKQDPHARLVVTENFIRAHQLARAAVKAIAPDIRVGMTVAMTDFQALPGGESRLQAIRRLREDVFLDAAECDDFIGVNAYTRHQVGADGVVPVPAGAEVTQMGYEFWPGALEATVRRAAEVLPKTPVLVTESGIGTEDDRRRIAYIEASLAGLSGCLRDGIDVRGYIHWSALDNFEWSHGYGPKFGLIALDRPTRKRSVKPSGYRLGDIARLNTLPEPLDG